MPSKVIASHLSNISDSGYITMRGNVTLDLFGCTGGFSPPSGTTAQRPSNPVVGCFRWNTETKKLEYYSLRQAWSNLILKDDFDTSVPAGSVIYYDIGDAIAYNPLNPSKINTQTFHLDLDGTVNNSIPIVTDLGFSVLNFSSSNHYISIPTRYCDSSATSPAFRLNSGFTYSFWLKPNSAGNVGTNLQDKVFFSINSSDGLTNVLKLGIDPQGSGLYYYDSTVGDQRIGTLNYNNDAYINIVVTRPAGVSQTATFYVNNSSIGTLSGTEPDYTGGNIVTIGGVYNTSNTTVSSNYGGYFASCIIYDRSLSTTEITRNYDAFRYRYGL